MSDIEDNLQPLAESLLLSGVLEDVIEQHNLGLKMDPEWNTAKYIHVSSILRAFVYGVLSADMWHTNYKLPPNFESVVNWIAFCIQRKWPTEEIPCVSILELEQLFREWAFEHPDFKKWNESPNNTLISVVTRYSEIPDTRDFIDLDALLRNAAVYVRNYHREFERFDSDFELKYSISEGKNE